MHLFSGQKNYTYLHSSDWNYISRHLLISQLNIQSISYNVFIWIIFHYNKKVWCYFEMYFWILKKFDICPIPIVWLRTVIYILLLYDNSFSTWFYVSRGGKFQNKHFMIIWANCARAKVAVNKFSTKLQ